MFCSKCGTQYEDGASFCTRCGNNLQKNRNIQIKNGEYKQVKQKKRNRKGLIAVIIVLLGMGVILWRSGILMGKNTDVTRGYNSSTSVEEILEKEEKNRDTTKILIYTVEEIWDERSGIFRYNYIETDDVNEISLIECEGGKLLGMKAKVTRFYPYEKGGNLYKIYYVYPLSDYDKVEEKISKKFEDYRIVQESGEYWSMENYNVDIVDRGDEYFGVTVTFNK